VKFGAVSQRLSIDTAGVVPLLPFLDAALGGPESVRVTQEVLL